MLNNHNVCKDETPYKGLFWIKQCWTNGTVSLKCGGIEIRYNIRQIKPYKSDAKVKDINSKNMYDDVNMQITSYILLYTYKILEQGI